MITLSYHDFGGIDCLSKGLAGASTGNDEDKANLDIVMGIIQLYLSHYNLDMADGVARHCGTSLRTPFTL